MKLTTAQIGKCGELLVQQKLLYHGVDSAHLTTDAGIDLVAYSTRNGQPVTIQVKSNLKAKPAGGKGQPAVDWWVPENCAADIVAFVDLSTNRTWLLTMKDVREAKQQLSKKGFHVCMYVKYIPKKTGKKRPAIEFEKYLLEKRIGDFF